MASLLDDSSPLKGKIENIRVLQEALGSIYSPLHKSQEVIITCTNVSSKGLRFYILETGVLQASVVLPSDVFSSLQIDATFSIRLNLSLLLDCINMLPTTDNIQIYYNSPSLTFQSEETKASVVTLFAEGSASELSFHAHQIIGELVAPGETLRDMLMELEMTNAKTAEITLSPHPSRVRMRAPAPYIAGEPRLIREDEELNEEETEGITTPVCEVEIDESSDILRTFECHRKQTAVYRMESLKRVTKTLAASSTVKLSINEEGMLAVMSKMKNDHNDRGRGSIDGCFVEVIIVAEEIDEDEDENERRINNEEETDRDDDEMVIGTLEI